MVGVSEAEVRAALDGIVDPCSVVAGAPAGISEMGLVRSLELSNGVGGTNVRLRIGVTEPGCLMGASFIAQARARLSALEGVAEIEIEFDHANDWMPGDMDGAYRQRLEQTRSVRRSELEQRRRAIGG
jgi:metal-sulfur cluster biosynthetic enzyme